MPLANMLLVTLKEEPLVVRNTVFAIDEARKEAS
jgi:hypothetical protein